MRVAVMHGPGDVRVEDRPEPTILKPTDAIIRLAASCICGSDLWAYWGVEPLDQPRRMGHEYAGIVEEVGSAVTTVKPGQFVVGSFFASDNTCEICRAGYHSSCIHREAACPDGAQAERMRVPLADGTLVATPDLPSDDLIASLLAASDVLGTGWFGAVAAQAGPGKTVAAVGDGAVGLLGIVPRRAAAPPGRRAARPRRHRRRRRSCPGRLRRRRRRTSRCRGRRRRPAGRDQVVVGDLGGGDQGAVGQRHPHPLRLRAVRGGGLTVDAGGVVAGPADLAGVVGGEERADHELAGPNRGDRGSDLLHDAGVLVSHRPRLGPAVRRPGRATGPTRRCRSPTAG